MNGVTSESIISPVPCANLSADLCWMVNRSDILLILTLVLIEILTNTNTNANNAENRLLHKIKIKLPKRCPHTSYNAVNSSEPLRIVSLPAYCMGRRVRDSDLEHYLSWRCMLDLGACCLTVTTCNTMGGITVMMS